MLPGRSLWNQIFVFGYKITLKRDSEEGKTNVGLSCWWLLSGKIYVTRSMTRQTDSDQISLLTHHNQHTVIRTQLTWSRINCVTVYLEISVNTASNNNNISNNKYVLTLNMKKHKLLYEKEKKNKHLLIVMTITAFLRCCLLMTPTVWIWTLLLIILLFVSGELSPSIRTGYTCEGEELMIQCDQDEQIQIIRANFGRFSIAICNDDGKTHWSVNCMSPKTRHILQNK